MFSLGSVHAFWQQGSSSAMTAKGLKARRLFVAVAKGRARRAREVFILRMCEVWGFIGVSFRMVGHDRI